MSTPTETAAESFTAHGVPASVAEAAARDAFASLAQHRDDIAREVHRAWCCTELYGVPDGHALSDEDRAVTDAVLAYLTGEAS